MPQDSYAVVLRQMENAITDLEVRFRAVSLEDRVVMRPYLEQLLSDYANYRLRLVKDDIITTDQDLSEMKQIQLQIDGAAQKQDLLKAIARTAAFIATKI